ncbi:MAG: 4Fe-4S binding protein, partial [Desulfovibrio sp.]|nr:4Fe-4S binding protein [Desulfovibrio sp.]
NCPIITCPGRLAQMFWGVWAGWLALALFCGRSFCGWICVGGFVQRILSLFPKHKRLDCEAAKTFSYGKYIVLLLALGAYFFLNQPRVNVPIRIEGEFWQSVALTFEFAFPLWLFRTGLVLILVALALVVTYSWCRFACPMGGLLEICKRISLFSFFRTKECNNCNRCLRECVMGTRPGEENCTNCGDCVSVCPQNCIQFGVRWKKK